MYLVLIKILTRRVFHGSGLKIRNEEPSTHLWFVFHSIQKRFQPADPSFDVGVEKGEGFALGDLSPVHSTPDQTHPLFTAHDSNFVKTFHVVVQPSRENAAN